MAEFLRFRPGHEWKREFSPDPDGPVLSVTWYDAAAYCNWLSEWDGVPPDQWCYAENPDGGGYRAGMRIRPGHLGLSGYRLPTEAEWEYACRAGTSTPRSHGRGDELLPRYGWFLRTAGDRARPVGRLRPNDLGLFDAHGNAFEWCEDLGRNPYPADRPDDEEDPDGAVVDDRSSRVLRGGSFIYQPANVRSAYRNFYRPDHPGLTMGFRVARTVVSPPGRGG